MRQGIKLTMAGLALGLLLSLALARLVTGLLFEVTPADPVTFVGVAAVIGAAALLACCLPAVMALGISPMFALRAE